MSAVEPHFFGPAERRLFGLYHAPLGRGAREAGVLLCYPGPQEYLRCHWAFRRLEKRLARAGLHVLRFDYYGSGDSAGDSRAGSLAQWRRDVATALAELREVSGVPRVSLVGFRLGAALAAQAQVRVRELVLWEPVVSGREHVAELLEQHELRFAHCLYPPPARGELLGLPFPPALQAELEAVELAAPLACRAERVVVVASEERPAYRRLVEGLRAAHAAGAGPAVEWRHVPEDAAAESDDGFLLSTRAQQAVAALLAGKDSQP